jgi:hypothetical protein
MKHLLTLLLLGTCAAAAQGQIIKSLGYNTTNGNVVYSGTNALTFTNPVRLPFGGNSTNLGLQFSTNATGFYVEGSGDQGLVMVHNGSVAFGATANVAVFYRSISFSSTALATATRTNLSLGATWLTNTNVTNFRTAIGLGLPALTNTSNVTMMRALAGSTNTNEPFSGSISVVGTNNTNTLVFSNGILLSQ